ncbi:MAG: outer membrane beta-barrel protein [Myxococcota bacterium]
MGRAVFAVVLLTSSLARAEEAPDGGVAAPTVAADGADVDEQRQRDRLSGESAAALLGTTTAAGQFTLNGYAEAFYQWNFNQPGNNITNFRGFDNRHNTFTVANAVLDARWDFKRVFGRVALQIGHTPSTYYLAEPGFGGASGANATSAELWKYVQQANVGYTFDVGRGLLVEAGIFLSPIGPEGMAIKDNWNWSRSNLFFGLPYYHTGARTSLPLTERWTVTLAGYNGWNSVVDNNKEKSVSVQATYTVPERLAVSLLYFGGVERPADAVEGRAWRHLFDAHLTWILSPRLSLLLHLNGGFEPNQLGLAAWGAGAVYGRFQLTGWLWAVARFDGFIEQTPAGGTPLFWPGRFMASQTLTLDARPHERVSIRLEYRHDEAGGPVFFDRAGAMSQPRQDTLTLGVTTWF